MACTLYMTFVESQNLFTQDEKYSMKVHGRSVLLHTFLKKRTNEKKY